MTYALPHHMIDPMTGPVTFLVGSILTTVDEVDGAEVVLEGDNVRVLIDTDEVQCANVITTKTPSIPFQLNNTPIQTQGLEEGLGEIR
jgi:hypothetical protein